MPNLDVTLKTGANRCVFGGSQQPQKSLSSSTLMHKKT